MWPVAASLSSSCVFAPPSPSLDDGSRRCFLMTDRLTDRSLFFTLERMLFAMEVGPAAQAGRRRRGPILFLASVSFGTVHK